MSTTAWDGGGGHCVVICVQAYSTIRVQKDGMPTQAASLAHLGLLRTVRCNTDFCTGTCMNPQWNG